MQCPACGSSLVVTMDRYFWVCTRCDHDWHQEKTTVAKRRAPTLYDPFPLDTLLRSAGFRILRRENGKEAVWGIGGDLYGRGGEELPESQAIMVAIDGSKNDGPETAAA